MSEEWRDRWLIGRSRFLRAIQFHRFSDRLARRLDEWTQY